MLRSNLLFRSMEQPLQRELRIAAKAIKTSAHWDLLFKCLLLYRKLALRQPIGIFFRHACASVDIYNPIIQRISFLLDEP